MTARIELIEAIADLRACCLRGDLLRTPGARDDVIRRIAWERIDDATAAQVIRALMP